MDFDTTRKIIEKSITDARASNRLNHPRLLFGPEDSEALKERAHRVDGFVDTLLEKANSQLANSPMKVERKLVRSYSEPLESVSLAFYLTNQEKYLSWILDRVKALVTLDTWLAPVHASTCKHCDHVMANVSAHIAGAFDLVAANLSEHEARFIADGVSNMHLDFYVRATEDRDEWWSKRDCESNWKIMTHGDSGYSTCCFAEYRADAPEALARAAIGVTEILDMVPPEGDWPEGVNYWYGTLRLGLRFARALYRLTDGGVDLFTHAALGATGDFAASLHTPGGRIYNFGDNGPSLTGAAADALYLLGDATGRSDWIHLAGTGGGVSIISLLMDGMPDKSTTPKALTARFPRSGVATCRSGHSSTDSFLGFRCGPSNVGHSHLDAASFVFEYCGTPLVWGEATWPYAHFLGFFDSGGNRWNWDNLATLGHTTLLVDGQGQTYGGDYPGRVGEIVEGDGWSIVSGDASLCYPGLLAKFSRSIMFVHPGTLIVRDLVTCVGERQVSWLLHPEGIIEDIGEHTVVRNNDCSLWVTQLLPDNSFGFRVSDITRRSTYINSNSGESVSPSIRYRAFEPFRASGQFEFLVLMRGTKNRGEPSQEFHWKPESGNASAGSRVWQLVFDGFVLAPDGDGIKRQVV